MTAHSDSSKILPTYPPLVNAAWYVLSPFVNPADCASTFSFTGDDGLPRSLIVPLNKNNEMEAFYNGDLVNGKRPALHWLTKGRIQAHLRGSETYYYRSRPNGRARLGYGGYAGATARIGFDHRELNVTSPVHRYDHVGMLLVCVDIDAHRGEVDAHAVRDWLLEEFFAGAYCEPSTSGRGVHVYLKVAYRPWQFGSLHTTRRHVCDVIRDFARRLDDARLARGFDSKVDGLLGLPSLLDFQGERIRIRRSRCVKLPRFAGGMSDIKVFHLSPVFLFGAFESGMGLASGGTPLPVAAVCPEACPWDRIEDVLDRDFETGFTLEKSNTVITPSGSGGVGLNSAYPRYEDILIDLRQIEDAYERSLSFVQVYSRWMGTTPTVTAAIQAYEDAGLNTGTDEGGRRQARFEYIVPFVARTFRAVKGNWLPKTFESVRGAVEAELRRRLKEHPRAGTYQKAKGRTYSVSVERLAAGWFAMWHSQGRATDTAFSYPQMNKALKHLTRKTACRAEVSACFAALEELEAITFVRAAVPSMRGTRYTVTPW